MNHFLLIKGSPGQSRGREGSEKGETLLKFPESKRDGYKKVIGFVQWNMHVFRAGIRGSCFKGGRIYILSLMIL